MLQDSRAKRARENVGGNRADCPRWWSCGVRCSEVDACYGRVHRVSFSKTFAVVAAVAIKFKEDHIFRHQTCMSVLSVLLDNGIDR